MDHLQDISKELGFNKKRERVLKNEYRNGILGVDDPIRSASSLYQDKHNVLKQKEINHRIHLVKRQRNIARCYGVSEQIEFSNNQLSKRPDHMHHDISPLWNRKKRIEH